MPKILDYKNFCETLDEISSLKLISKKKFHPRGLFSEQIFGPIRNYTCQCGIYYGVSKAGGKCETCGVDIVNSDERRKRFAKITLPIPVVNPIMYDLICDLGGKEIKKSIDELMKNDKSSLVKTSDDEYFVKTEDTAIPETNQTWQKTEAIYEIIKFTAQDQVDSGNNEWKIILDNIENVLLSTVIVLPPDLRPTSKTMQESKQLMDKINRYYVQILTKKEIMKDTIIDIQKDKPLYYTYFKQLQKDVFELYERILEKMAKKEGLIRGNILGKRIDFSGRAVITPEPTLSLEECELPYLMILEIYKLPIAKRIIELGKFKLLNKAIDFVDECIEKQSPVLFKIASEITKDEVCILNRQPSLHKLGMLGFKIKVTLDQVVKIHPLVCPPFNADFDGDQMAVYIPITEEAKEEIRNKISIKMNLSSPANESLTTTPSQDIVLGIYFLTSNCFPNTNGQKMFMTCLPEDYPEVTGVVDNKRLIEILTEIKDKYSEDITVRTLDNIKKLGFKAATLYGCTISLDDCEMQNSKEIKDFIYEGNSIRKQLSRYSNPKLVDEMRKQYKYSYFIDSGARGSWDQVKQLILTRGFISNFDGQILPIPIKSNLVEGLTQEEFFYSTYGCRKGLLDVALNTGTSGYLSRKLVFTCANLQLDKDLNDCGTNDTLQVDVNSERKARMLVNRYQLKNDKLEKITIKNYKKIVGKVINIRSPIFCKSPKICTTCYGDLYKTIRSRFIGVLAAQTLGEKGTQLVLRTFHTSGSAVVQATEDSKPNMKQKDIIGDLAIVAELLHKFKDKTAIQIAHQLFEAYDKDIYHIHFECVVSQLMWHGNRKWRLLPERNQVNPTFYSIQSVPNHESWILAMAFSNPKRSILNGVLYEGLYSGIMDKILKGEKIT
jgi:DNA-directed RNA polymerase subunit beta'